MEVQIKIHILHTGEVQVDRALPFSVKSLNPIAYTGLFRSKKHRISLPVSAYLIEHPKGQILIDTGWHADMRINQVKHLGFFHYIINKGTLPPGEAIHEQLAARGIEPKDLDYVVMTHLHSDHASGLKHVKDAKKILVSGEELNAANKDWLRYIPHMWKGVNLKPFNFSKSTLGPKQRSFDLFEDGSVVFVHTPGHSKGLVATLIRRGEKYVLLTSDVGYSNESWEKMILPGIMVNKEDVLNSLAWVKEMAANPNCVEAIANHDINVKPHTIIL